MATVNPGDEGDPEKRGAKIARRFDAVQWQSFTSNDKAAQSKTRFEVLDIRKDLLKVAEEDVKLAAKIWDEHVPTFVPRPFEFPQAEPDPPAVNIIMQGRRRRVPAEPYLDRPQAAKAVDDGLPAKEPTKPAQFPAKPEARHDPNFRDEKAAHDSDGERARFLLEGLGKQYLQADNRFHFRSRGGEVAFEAQEKRLLTTHDTPAVVTSMIDLAEARGWSSLKLTGTKAFKREAWLQANMRGLDVSGYQPDVLDKAQLGELRAERAQTTPKNTIARQDTGDTSDVKPKPDETPFKAIVADGAPEARIPLTATQAQFLAVMEATMKHRGDTPAAIAKARELGIKRLTSERVHVGTLVEVGTAPFQDKKGEKASHFVTLQDEDGKQSKVWGVDLPRALDESGAKPGQRVAIVFEGRKPVEVDVTIKDASGKTIGTERQTVERNSWKVVEFEALREDAKAAVLKAAARQERPAELKVFDRTASPQAPPPRPRTQRTVERDRTM